MVKHIILWTLKSEYTESEKQEIKAGIKEGLEGLSGKLRDLLKLRFTQKDFLVPMLV